MQGVRSREVGEDLGRLIEEGDLFAQIDHDDAVFQTGQNIFPGDLGGVASFFISDFHLRAMLQKLDKIIADMIYQENINKGAKVLPYQGLIW